MALPVSVPYAFANATTTQNLAYLDSNFNTLSYTLNGIGNGTISLANVSITGGTISANVSATSIHNGTSNVSVDSANGPVSINTNGTNAMYIDASQNVGIGTTSPTSKIHAYVASGGITTLTNSNGTTVSDYAQTLSKAGTITTELTSYGSGLSYVFSNASTAMNIGSTGTAYMALFTNNAERMRIDSSGNVGIGTASPGAKLEVLGTTGAYAFFSGTSQRIILGDVSGTPYIQALNKAGSNSGLAFYNYSSEAMRIDTSGNLLVGTTVYGATVNDGVSIGANGNIFSNIANATNTNHVYDINNSVYRFYVSGAGQIYATSTSITAISDQSLKTNIKPLETGLAEVMRLQPRRFDWINGDGENKAGFIAQEVEQVLPDLVAPYKYNDDDTKLGLKMGDMIPTLVAAIQEQQKLIQELSAEVTALKAKVGA